MFNRLLLVNIKVALESIRGQLLRTVLTVLIIAFGIMALVGILTATDAIKSSIEGNFSDLGANTFAIQNRALNIQIGRGGQVPKKMPPITFDQARNFAGAFDYGGAIASISFSGAQAAEVKSASKKTDPNITIMGVDQHYLQTSGYELSAGRNFNEKDLENQTAVAILGQNVVTKLFGNTPPLGQVVVTRGVKYRVIGVLKEKGQSSAFSGDGNVLIPLTKGKSIYASPNRTYSINVMASSAEILDATIGEATAKMRQLRQLSPKEEDNFAMVKSDALAKSLIENIEYVTFAAAGIGFITLLGAAISLMNIMLVSVTERTREIGTRKAMGAKSNSILSQFLVEAIVICQLGGVFGILFGIGIGNIVSLFLSSPFIIPWFWMGMAVIICLFVGVVSGLYPAIKAASLDPIEALRYE
jgi:putative ABC transport system permease protein